LKDIKGPQAVSTVAKSAFDWDNYKEKEGIEDDLAIASKDGFVIFMSLIVTFFISIFLSATCTGKTS
jgi:hypothetical protein